MSASDAVPAGGADDHLRAGGEARAHVLDDRFRRGEVDDDVEAGDERRRQRAGALVLQLIEHMNAVAALGGNFGDELAGLSLPKHQDSHEGSLLHSVKVMMNCCA